MREFTVGFAFTPDRHFVYMIKKAKPEWQAGCINGVGGKLEAGETPYEAMVREFKEETGVSVENWKEFATMGGPDWKCWLYATILSNSDTALMNDAVANHFYDDDIQEPVVLVARWNLTQGLGLNSNDRYKMIDNIPMLVEAAALALDEKPSMDYFIMGENFAN